MLTMRYKDFPWWSEARTFLFTPCWPLQRILHASFSTCLPADKQVSANGRKSQRGSWGCILALSLHNIFSANRIKLWSLNQVKVRKHFYHLLWWLHHYSHHMSVALLDVGMQLHANFLRKARSLSIHTGSPQEVSAIELWVLNNLDIFCQVSGSHWMEFLDDFHSEAY